MKNNKAVFPSNNTFPGRIVKNNWRIRLPYFHLPANLLILSFERTSSQISNLRYGHISKIAVPTNHQNNMMSSFFHHLQRPPWPQLSLPPWLWPPLWSLPSLLWHPTTMVVLGQDGEESPKALVERRKMDEGVKFTFWRIPGFFEGKRWGRLQHRKPTLGQGSEVPQVFHDNRWTFEGPASIGESKTCTKMTSTMTTSWASTQIESPLDSCLNIFICRSTNS